MSNLENVSLEELRAELQKRVELGKAQRESRIKELQDIIVKSQKELQLLIGQNKPQPQKDKIPGIVKAAMPKELRQAEENGQQLPPPTVVKSQQSSGKPGKPNRCPQCEATSSNWEYSNEDDTMYCVCGFAVVENVSESGFSR